MARYEYTCERCGRFEVRAPIGTAPERSACPACHGRARRAFSPPMLGRVPKAIAAWAEREQRSSDAPEVVSRVPAGRARRSRPPDNPAISQLPRP